MRQRSDDQAYFTARINVHVGDDVGLGNAVGDAVAVWADATEMAIPNMAATTARTPNRGVAGSAMCR